MSTTTTPLHMGVAGLGRAFTLMLPSFVADARVRLVAAADPLPQARAQFERDFGGCTYDSVEALCADPQVQVLYIATPHQFHAAHVQLAAAHGKHILLEKPMAITLEQCTAMVEAVQAAGVHMVVGHSHSFDAPILHTWRLISSGRYGRVRMLTALNFTDFLYRPRRPEELDTRQGGGVIHSQATHQIDTLRLLGGGLVRSVTAHTANWDATRPTEGAYHALLDFEDGCIAQANYSGYGHFDSDAWMEGVGEMGQAKNLADHGAARRRLASAVDTQAEAALKAARNYGGGQQATMPAPAAHAHFGPLIVSCEGADLRPTPSGVQVLGHLEQHFEPLPLSAVPRQEVIDELHAAVVESITPLHDGPWARATTEVCLGILASSEARAPATMHWQVATARAAGR